MKRRQFLTAVGAGAATAAIAKPAIAQSMPELKWRCTTSWPKSLDVPFSASETIAKYVAEATDNKFQIQPFAGGEIVPPLPGGRCGRQRHRRDGPHRRLLFHRQGPDLRALLLGAVRPEFAPAERLVPGPRRPGHAQRVRQEVQRLWHRRRQHRHADGRLVPQGDQDGRGLQGPQDAHRRLGRQDAGQARPRSAADSPAATSIRRWKRAPSTPPSGSAPTTTRSSASTRSPSTTITRAGGKAAPRCTSSSTPTNGMRCRRPISRCSRWRAATPIWTCRRNTTRAIRRRSSAWWRRARSFARSRTQIMEACLKASNEVNAETSATNPDYKKILRLAAGVPQRRKSVVAGGRIHLRELHDPQPSQGLIGAA